MIDKGKTIVCPNLILCEGKDEWSFLVNYLAYLVKKDTRFDTIQVMDFGGINDLSNQLRQLVKMPNFSMVKSLLIIRDAEKDPKAAKESICSSLKNHGFAIQKRPGDIVVTEEGIKVAYMLLPSCDKIGDEPGTLEDFCLKIISEPRHEDVLSEIDNYLTLMNNKYSLEYPRKHKNKLHMLISSYDKYVGAKAGEAGQRGLYDWESVHLKGLRNLMLEMCSNN